MRTMAYIRDLVEGAESTVEKLLASVDTTTLTPAESIRLGRFWEAIADLLEIGEAVEQANQTLPPSA